VAGVAGELERSLRGLDGVVSVRVHLAVPVQDALSPDETPTQPSASVLLRHRGAQPPIATNDVQRLVAGAVPGLRPAQVSVVALPVPALARPAERELSRFGRVTVTRGSVFPLRLYRRWRLAAEFGATRRADLGLGACSACRVQPGRAAGRRGAGRASDSASRASPRASTEPC